MGRHPLTEHQPYILGTPCEIGDIIKCTAGSNFALVTSFDNDGWPILKMLNENEQPKPGSSLPIKSRFGAPAIVAAQTAEEPAEEAPKKRRGRPRKVEAADV